MSTTHIQPTAPEAPQLSAEERRILERCQAKKAAPKSRMQSLVRMLTKNCVGGFNY